jgi:translocation and assembly module TamB
MFLLVVLLLLLAILFYLSATENGTSRLLGWASSRLPALTIEKTQGALLDELTVQTIVWQKDGLSVEVSDATLELSVPTPDIQVNKLIAKRITVQLPKTVEEPDDNQPFSIVIPNIHLPLNIDLSQVEVDELVIHQGEALITLRDVTLRAEVKNDTLLLHQLAGDLYDDEGSVVVAAKGEMGLSTPHLIDLKVNATANSQRIGVGTIKLAAQGEVTNYELNIEGDWKYASYPTYAVDFNAKGNLEQLEVKKLHLDGDAGAVELQGHMTWSPELNWDLALTGKKLNPAVFVPDYSGELTMVWATTGSLTDKVRMQLELKQLTGRLQDYPIDANMQLAIEDNVVTLNTLQAQVGDNQLTATGKAGEKLDIDWQFDAPKLAQFHKSIEGHLDGKGRLVGKPSESQFALSIVQLKGKVLDYPVQAKGGVRVDDQLLSVQDLSFSVGKNRIALNGSADEKQGIDWQLQAKDLSQLSPELKGKLQGNGNIKGLLDGSKAIFSIVQLKGKVLNYPIRAKGNVRIDDQLLSAQNFSVSVGDNRIALNGSADEKKGINWKLQAKNLSQLSPELKGTLEGKGNVKGLLDGSRATLHIETLAGRIQDFPVQAKGTLTVKDQVINAQNVLLNVGKNQLKLNGNAAEDLGVDWEINAPKLSQLHSELKGNIKGSGKASGALDGSAFKLHIARLKGKLQGRPLSAKGKISAKSGEITLDDVLVQAGKNRLQVDGKASEPFDLKWKLDAPRLKQVWADLGGSLKSKGRLSGKLDALQIQADLKGKRLRYQDISIRAIDMTAKQKGSVYDLNVRLQAIKQGETLIQKVILDGKGKITAHTLSLALQHKDGKVDLQATGGWKKEQWKGALEQLNLRDTPAGNWQLNKAVQIKASAEMVSSSDFCLANKANAQICAETKWSAKKGVQSKGRLQRIPMAMARPWLPETVTFAGLVNANFDFKQQNGKPKGELDLQLPDSSVTLRMAEGKTEVLHYRNTFAKVMINDKKARFNAAIELKDRGLLQAEGKVDLADNPQQSQLNASATISVPDLNWVEQFSNDIDQLQGKLQGKVSVAGTLGKPRVTGALQLQNASLLLPETGAHLEAINLTVQANRADQLLITGTLKAGEGILNAKGKLTLAQLPKWSADMTLSGKRLLLMNTHEVQAYVSPQLTIKASPDKVAIDGTVTIPETTITLRELPVSAKKRSDDIVIVRRSQQSRGQHSKVTRASGETRSEASSALSIKPNVNVVLGDDVSFSGFGLDTHLTGKLQILTIKQETVAQGVLSIVDGVYKAYGQDLEIEKGRLLFDGAIDNPGLDVRAVRHVPNDIQVGIALRGTAQNPESELFSEPQQTQTDTLSYLLTGRSISSASSGDSAMLTNAITGLGIDGGESLAQKIGGKLGFDEVGIGSSDGNYKDSELSLGKKIGSKLYVKYIVGLFDSLQKVAVTYQINQRLQAEVRSGEQQEADVHYKFNTDKGLFGR